MTQENRRFVVLTVSAVIIGLAFGGIAHLLSG